MATQNKSRKILPLRGVRVTRSYLTHELSFGPGKGTDPNRSITVRLSEDQAKQAQMVALDILKANGITYAKGMHIFSLKPAMTYPEGAERVKDNLVPYVGPDGKRAYDLTIKIKPYNGPNGTVSAAQRVDQIQVYNSDNTPAKISEEPGGELTGYTVDLNLMASLYYAPGTNQPGVTAYLNQIRITNRPVRGFQEFAGVDEPHGFDEGYDDIPVAPAEEEAVEVNPELELPFPIDEDLA